MSLGRQKVALAAGGLIAAVALLCAPGAAADSMVVQPDGRIVLASGIWPEAGAIARLGPEGALDPSFGRGGFEIDRRIAGIRALALQPDGRLVAAAVGGSPLTRYLADGSPDPTFAGGGVGGTDEPDQVHFFYENYGPVALLVQPGGRIVVAGVHEANGGGATDSWVRSYDAAGNLVETVGGVPLANRLAAADLSDLLELPDGSFAGAGWNYRGDSNPSWALLARFVPGSGNELDPGFGAGAGLVEPAFPVRTVQFGRGFGGLALSGEKLLAAGRAAGTLLLARFNRDGTLDSGFGQGGFVTPPVQGPGDVKANPALEQASSWANDVGVTATGDAVLAGGTSQWGSWRYVRDIGPNCSECPQPLLARFDAGGNLDPSFGSGGLLRLQRPDGSNLIGEAEQVLVLGDGKLLVKGKVQAQNLDPAFVARLNPDGSYDPSFGQGGLTILEFPCTNQPEAERRRAGCIPAARLKLSLGPVGRRQPALRLHLRPNVPWAAIGTVTVTLPRRLRLSRGFRSKLRLVGAATGAEVTVGHEGIGDGRTYLRLAKLGGPRRVTVALGRGALRLVGRRPPARLRFEVGAEFKDARWGTEAGRQTVIRSVRWRSAGHR